MKKIAWLAVCCCLFVLAASCTKKEGSEQTASKESTEEMGSMDTTGTMEETAEEVALAGTWKITEWKADNVDQFEMWRIGDLTVELKEDGSVETHLVYSNGDERSSGGTWDRDGDKLDIHLQGGNETEGDEPFDRTREFMIDELTEGALAVHAEIGPAERPVVVSYKAERVVAPME
jgi:hypothetical protein